MSGPPSSAPANASRPPGWWLRRYWLAVALAAAGLAATAVAGRQMDRWAQARDAERFAAECRMVVGMIEQKMERYESALNRVRDACARNHGEVSRHDWNGWLSHTLRQDANYPAIRCLLVAPRILEAEREAFGQRAAAQVYGHPGEILTSRSQAREWLPVWRRSAPLNIALPGLGDDLLAETPQHPSFEPVIGNTFGWVSGQPSRLPTTNGLELVGFWFALPIRPLEFTNSITWQRPNETGEAAVQRRARQRTEQTTGLLAAFIGGDLFLAQSNRGTNLLRVQLFASKTPSPETLLNPAQPSPAQARFTHDQIMPWYGRRWTARFSSTPVFEAGSLGYRAALVWWIGIPLSLAGAAALGWQTRSRWREAALAEQLRDALSRQERLSRDLHDGTLQSVYGVGLGLQRAQRLLERRPADAAGQLADTTLAVQRVIGELRAVIRETDPTAHADVPLGEALAGVVAHLKFATEMDLQLSVVPGADLGLTPAQALQLLNIAREAVSNSVRHSGARQVRITLTQPAGTLRLEVADDGCGFDSAGSEAQGRGLRNLAARVRELGGLHRWESAAGQGSRLIVEVPFSRISDGQTT